MSYNVKTNYITPTQLSDICNNLEICNIRKWQLKDVRLIIKICYWCALRMNEAVKIKLEDIDLINRTIDLGTTKTKKHDRAIIPIGFINELEQELKDRQAGLLLSPPCQVQNIYKWLLKIGKELNIRALTELQADTHEKTKCHIFRKSRGKDYLHGTNAPKLDLFDIEKILRHSNILMTERYLKADEERIKEQI